MFRSGTLFIVGAGASAEVGLPVGKKLMRTISSKLNLRFDYSSTPVQGDGRLVEAMRALANPIRHDELNQFVHAGQQIAAGLQTAASIDNFLHTHQSDAKILSCGKLAIVQSILEAESHSKLYLSARERNEVFDFEKVEDTWFHSFSVKLMEGYPKEKISQVFDNISIICFNYDRCIEHYLSYALATYFQVDFNEASSVVEGLRIIHPYGTVAQLGNADDQETLPFGYVPNGPRLVPLAGRIRTFTEGLHEGVLIDEMEDYIQQATQIIFLGFGYLEQNMKLLRIATNSETLVKENVWGTAFDVSESDVAAIRNSIHDTLDVAPNAIELHRGMSCSGLFKEHWHGL